MQLEFHQLDRRWQHLRVRHPARQRRLLASLAESGQQTPIVVVPAEGEVDRYVVIDGYKRIAALEQLGWDTVEAVIWPMTEPAAVPKAITAAAHKLARIVYHLLTTKEPYDDSVFAKAEERYRKRSENRLKAQAQALGFTLVPTPL